ncbi:unnamed protein product [Amoebophrya sp. A120]|nr:unnamed protein product [Amoebophrya sp. A120]|eukprot:GSA120T00006739001.1
MTISGSPPPHGASEPSSSNDGDGSPTADPVQNLLKAVQKNEEREQKYPYHTQSKKLQDDNEALKKSNEELEKKIEKVKDQKIKLEELQVLLQANDKKMQELEQGKNCCSSFFWAAFALFLIVFEFSTCTIVLSYMLYNQPPSSTTIAAPSTCELCSTLKEDFVELKDHFYKHRHKWEAGDMNTTTRAVVAELAMSATVGAVVAEPLKGKGEESSSSDAAASDSET